MSEPPRVYTLVRRACACVMESCPKNDVFVIEGRLPDGSFIPWDQGSSQWAFVIEAEALEFWAALISCAELDPWPTRFVDTHETEE